MIEEIEHEDAARSQADIGALVDIANVDQDRISILPSPSADLSGTTREPADIQVSLVISGRENVSVQVRRMKN
jgi:hypothetical protein